MQHLNVPALPEQTLEQQLEHINMALDLWVQVNHSAVVPDLCYWRSESAECGTQACFGGHLATWDYFRSLGVLTRAEMSFPETFGTQHDFAPCALADRGYFLAPDDIAERLFGDKRLFGVRLIRDATISMTDHEIVTDRLQAAKFHVLARLAPES